VGPRGEALGAALGARLLDQGVEHVARDLLQELTEEAGDSYHRRTLRFVLADWAQDTLSPTEGSIATVSLNPILDKSEKPESDGPPGTSLQSAAQWDA
jgi:hypothetical protein